MLAAGALAWTSRDTAETKGPPIGTEGTPKLPAPITTAATLDPQATTKAEVLAAYRASWDEQLAVGRDLNATADDDRLRAHRTGEALVTIQLSLVKHKASGEIYAGDVRLNPSVLELGPATATIADCIDDAVGTVNAKTGAVVEPAKRLVTTVTVSMTLIAGVWKQSKFHDEEKPCTPAPA